MPKYLNRKIYILCFVTILIFAALLIYLNNINNKEEKSYRDLNITIYRVIAGIKDSINDRKYIINNDAVLIGESEKELENGYYDIKFEIETRTLKIRISKLWKEFTNELYEEQYVDELVCGIEKILEINDTNEILKKYIMEGYKEAKNLESNNQENVKYKFEIESKRFEGYIDKREFILIISKEV